jgi:hypothetical protein
MVGCAPLTIHGLLVARSCESMSSAALISHGHRDPERWVAPPRPLAAISHACRPARIDRSSVWQVGSPRSSQAPPWPFPRRQAKGAQATRLMAPHQEAAIPGRRSASACRGAETGDTNPVCRAGRMPALFWGPRTARRAADGRVAGRQSGDRRDGSRRPERWHMDVPPRRPGRRTRTRRAGCPEGAPLGCPFSCLLLFGQAKRSRPRARDGPWKRPWTAPEKSETNQPRRTSSSD